MNRNYQKELDRIIQKQGKTLPRVLLHGCCAPCSSSVLEYLTEYFDVTLLWYNPNIYPQEEFDRRFQALVKLIEDMGLADRVHILAEPWKSEDYYKRIQGLEQEPEGGRRCTECFRLRLMEAFDVKVDENDNQIGESGFGVTKEQVDGLIHHYIKEADKNAKDYGEVKLDKFLLVYIPYMIQLYEIYGHKIDDIMKAGNTMMQLTDGFTAANIRHR